ncbi:MAG: hypothetical protein C0483_20705 [Pirellula sp.]|nr:hypothetical protein [Pirellula sp.]
MEEHAMRPGLRAFKRLVVVGLFVLAAYGYYAARSHAPQAMGEDAPRSTLRIGAPRPSATPQQQAAPPRQAPAPANVPYTASSGGGSRLSIRPAAPTSPPVAHPAPVATQPPSTLIAPAQPSVSQAPALQPALAQPPVLQAPSTTAAAPSGAPLLLTPANPAPTAQAIPPVAMPEVASPQLLTPPPIADTATLSNTATPDDTATPLAPSAPLAPVGPAIRPLVRGAGTPNGAATQTPGVVVSDAPADAVTIAGDGTLSDAPAMTDPAVQEPQLTTPAPQLAAPTIKSAAPALPSRDVPSIAAPSIAAPANTPTPSAVLPPIAVKPLPAAPTPVVTTPMTSTPEVMSQTVDAAPAELALDTVAADPTRSQPLTLEPVDFNGVLLGETTLDEVLQSWGQPLARGGEGANARLKYQIDPFAGVEVSFIGGKATAVVVDLGDMFSPADVAKELNLKLEDTVAVEDAAGNELGLVFPERGVSMRYEDGAAEPKVAQIGLDQVSARPFVMRAERRRIERPTSALIDLATALKLNPEEARAHWLKSRILAAAGRPREALASVETALRLDPKSAEYLLTRAGLLADQGLFEAALKDNETVINGTQKLAHYQARAWRQRGDLLADGPAPDSQQSLDAHTRAMRIAETLYDDPTTLIRRDAKQTLIEAHLAIADDVAWGDFQAKEAATARWLVKAENLAKQGILEDRLSPYLILEVYQRGLGACVGTPGAVDPLDWAERLERTTAAALQDCKDPLKRRQIQFEAGLGLYDALQALHARGDVDNALRFGTVAVEMIQAGRVGRDEAPNDAYRFGRLYFRIGSLYAVAKNDHKQAVEWFDRSAPLLERPLADAAAADRGRQGETLVSMGLSYWTIGKRERGLQLTDLGTRFMQRAVSEETLAPDAMGVAYSNLAVMHDGLGDQTTGRRFHEMAARAEASAPTLQQGGTIRR